MRGARVGRAGGRGRRAVQERLGGAEPQGLGAVQVEAAGPVERVNLEALRELGQRPAGDVAKPGNKQALHRIYSSEMATVTLQPSGQKFQVEEGESILTAALRQDFILPYGCRNGACGSCKGKLLEGRVDYGVYQKKALPDEDKAQGKALFCQARPLGD